MNIARIVSQYLQKVKVTKDNTSLIAWIVELMAANREENPDWRNKKAWEENLTTQIFNLKAQTPNNSRLHVLLCADLFQNQLDPSSSCGSFSVASTIPSNKGCKENLQINGRRQDASYSCKPL